MAVRMQLSRIFIREMSDMQIIELTDPASGRSFPIVIGLPEAFAIERRLKGAEVPRPQTHDLLAAVIRELGASLQRIVIDDLRQGTFFAKLVIERDGRTHLVDSRPSDAIAIGGAVPGVAPVTMPVAAPTLALAGVALYQLPLPLPPVRIKVIFDPLHTDVAPDTTPA